MPWWILGCAAPALTPTTAGASCGVGEFAEAGGAEVREGESLQDAVDSLVATGGGTLVMGAGKWSETISLDATHAGVRIVGRCRELTTLDGGGSTGAVVAISGAEPDEFAVEGMTITGGRGGG